MSPKKTKLPREKIKNKANELKIIISNKHDFIWAEQQSVGVNKSCKLFLQPEWSKKEEVTPMIIDYIKENTKWTISLQSHKYMNIP